MGYVQGRDLLSLQPANARRLPLPGPGPPQCSSLTRDFPIFQLLPAPFPIPLQLQARARTSTHPTPGNPAAALPREAGMFKAESRGARCTRPSSAGRACTRSPSSARSPLFPCLGQGLHSPIRGSPSAAPLSRCHLPPRVPSCPPPPPSQASYGPGSSTLSPPKANQHFSIPQGHPHLPTPSHPLPSSLYSRPAPAGSPCLDQGLHSPSRGSPRLPLPPLAGLQGRDPPGNVLDRDASGYVQDRDTPGMFRSCLG